MVRVFVPTKPLTAAEVWAYATRALTDKAGFADRLANYRYYVAMGAGVNYVPPANTLVTALGLAQDTAPNVQFYDGAAWIDVFGFPIHTIYVDAGQNVRVHNTTVEGLKIHLTGVTWS